MKDAEAEQEKLNNAFSNVCSFFKNWAGKKKDSDSQPYIFSFPEEMMHLH